MATKTTTTTTELAPDELELEVFSLYRKLRNDLPREILRNLTAKGVDCEAEELVDCLVSLHRQGVIDMLLTPDPTDEINILFFRKVKEEYPTDDGFAHYPDADRDPAHTIPDDVMSMVPRPS